MNSVVTDITSYVNKKRNLLTLERDAEAEKVNEASSSTEALSSLEAAGAAVTRLSFGDRESTSSGRVIVELCTRGGRVISTRLSPGDIVSIRPHHRPKTGGKGAPKKGRKSGGDVGGGEEGVLVAVDETKLKVAVDDDAQGVLGGDDASSQHDLAGHLFAVIRVGSDVTFKRCNTALTQLERAFSSPSHPAYALCGVLYRGAEARFENDASLQLSPAQENALHGLNDVQLSAVRRAMCSKDAFAFHGPPGTGKTSTLVSFIVAEVLRGSRVLVVAPSNVAVDNIAEKLATFRGGAKIKFVRAGHPARIMESVSEHTLEAHLARTDEMSLARDIRAELSDLDRQAESSRGGARRTIRFEQRALRKELRKREGDALKRLLGRVECVLATTAGAGGRVLDGMTVSEPFDIVCVDEAGMATEASSLVAVLKGKRIVLAGDPFQLAPTVMSEEAQAGGLGKTLLDRMFLNPELHDRAVRMLVIQYRMHAVISDWSSRALYKDRLKAAPSVAKHTLAGLVSDGDGSSENPDISGEEQNEDDDILQQPWVLIDTSSCGYYESQEDEVGADQSKCNEGEADVVVSHVQKLLKAGLPETAIGVISPYSGQVKLLRSKLRGSLSGRGLEISTVDSFQGREKEAIVISLVRSNDRGSVGFLSDSRRLNVAVTRARRHVAIVCDSSTVSNDRFCSAMIDYASENGDYRVADEGAIYSSPIFPAGEFPAATSHGVGSPVASDRCNSRPVHSRATTSEDQATKIEKGSLSKKSRSRGKSTRRSDARSSGQQEVQPSGLENDVKAFAGDGGQQAKAFPASLTAGERRTVHAIAEELGLLHVTEGEGGQRFITVSKPSGDASTDKDKPSTGNTSATESSSCGTMDSSANKILGGQFDLLRQPDESHEHSSGEDGTPASPATATADECSEQAKSVTAGVDTIPISLSASIGPTQGNNSTNDYLRQLALERQGRKERQIGGEASGQTPSGCREGHGGSGSRLPPSTERIIVAGQLIGGSQAKEKAATAAARARLDNRLEEQADARKKKNKKNKK